MLSETVTKNRRRWLRMTELPFSRAHAYRLIQLGILTSVLLSIPGSKKPLRLIDGDALDEYLESLSTQQAEAGCDGKRKGPNKGITQI
jgi:hypothetical protein